MRAGRAFSEVDSRGGRVAIVNETLARQLFAGRPAVGARLWIAKVPYDVVGVVADYARNPVLASLPEPRVFVPLAPDSKDVTRMHFLVRAQAIPQRSCRRFEANAQGRGRNHGGRCGNLRPDD